MKSRFFQVDSRSICENLTSSVTQLSRDGGVGIAQVAIPSRPYLARGTSGFE